MRRTIFVLFVLILVYSLFGRWRAFADEPKPGVPSGVPDQLAQASGQTVDAPPQKRGDYALRVVQVGKKRLGAVRFQTATGESWTIGDGPKFIKMAESGPVPAGAYDILLSASEDDWMAFRIDRLTGATWQMHQNKWIKISAPDEKEK